MGDIDLRPALAAIASPTLVVVGALDVTTPPALARELAAGIRGAALVEIPACAHCPPIEKPAELLAALRRVEIKDAPRGPVKIDEYGNPTQNIYIRKVEK
ncbi:MAG TPA: hypothetical protein VNQ54_00605, partial [Methylomirabilota bacterium]|nr:hypothetical protein [Methylomirabilota bacterium]